MNIDYLCSDDEKELLSGALSVNYFSDIPLQARTYQNATLFPPRGWASLGGVVNCEGCFIKHSVWAGNSYEGVQQEDRYRVTASSRNLIFVGVLADVWGHALTDDLSRLWYLLSQEGIYRLQQGYEIAYTSITGNPMPRYLETIIRMLGLEPNLFHLIDNPLRCNSIIIPDPCFRGEGDTLLFTDEYLHLIELMKESVIRKGIKNPVRSSKVYLSRWSFVKWLDKTKDFGEEKLLGEMFEKCGYEVITPEKYSVEEQIAIAMNADAVAATEGSVAHISVFCKPSCQLVLLLKAKYVNTHQILINQIVQPNVVYVSAHHSSKVRIGHEYSGPFYVYPTKYLQSFLRLNIGKKYFQYFSYWKYMFRYSFVFRGVRKLVRMAKSLCSPRM